MVSKICCTKLILNIIKTQNDETLFLADVGNMRVDELLDNVDLAFGILSNLNKKKRASSEALFGLLAKL